MSNKDQVSPKLSDAQSLSLLAATQRPDGLVAVTERTPSLTGLRQSGLVLDKSKGADGWTVYRIAVSAQQAA